MLNAPLPWQRSHWERLLQAKAAERLPHGLLCSGPAGLGKGLFAERLAQALLCGAPAADGSPCDACRACGLVKAGSHPDYVRVQPVAESKEIRVDQIRELSAFLGYTSRAGGYKIALVTPAERMNLSAANSLLKTLEEPPPGSLLLLVTAAPAQLPATVRSRCQQLAFYPPPAEQALAWLAAQAGDDADPALALSLSHGAPLTARRYLEGDRLARRQSLFAGFQEMLGGAGDPVRTAELWTQGDPAEPLRWLIGWHVDMIRLKMAGQSARLVNPDLRQALQRLADALPGAIVFQRLDTVLRLHTLCTTQVNQPLMLEAFFAECAAERVNPQP